MAIPENPITREEQYLAMMSGQNITVPQPVTRIEQYLYKLATEGFTGDINDVVSQIVAQIVADAPEDFDTLKEISDWISSHANDASAMNSAILANSQSITTLGQNKQDKIQVVSADDFAELDTNEYPVGTIFMIWSDSE